MIGRVLLLSTHRDRDQSNSSCKHRADNNDFTGSGSSRPEYKESIVNGLPVARFDGVEDLLTASTIINGSTGRTLFILSKMISTGGTYDGALMSLDHPHTTGTGKTFTITPEISVRVSGNRLFNEGMGTSNFRILTIKTSDGDNVTNLEMFLDGTAGTGWNPLPCRS